MTEKKALDIFLSHFSAKVCKIERCGMGHGNYVYIIFCESEKFVIRCSNEHGAYVNTVFWLEQLEKLNIPASKVLAAGRYHNWDYLILTYLNGEDLGIVYPLLTKDEKRRIATEVVRIQNAASSIEFGEVDKNWSWYSSFVKDMLMRSKERIGQNGYFDIKKVDVLEQMAEEMMDYFSQVKPLPYLDDISTKNLLIDNGRVSGIIDVDWIGIGDRLTYAALTRVALLNMDCDTDYVGFLLAEMAIIRRERKAFVFYSLLFCVDFMGERGMQFGDKRIEVNETVIRRLNNMYDDLIAEWKSIDVLD